MQACLRTLSKAHIVSPGVNANNEGHGMHFHYMVSSTALMDDTHGNIRACEHFQNLDISQQQ